MKLRTILSVLGVAIAGVAFALVLFPQVAAGMSMGEAILVVLGVLALVQGVRIGASRLRTRYVQAETPDPEQSQELPTPGDEFDDLLREAGGDRRRMDSREQVATRLERAAIATIARTQSCSLSEARRRVESGEWTDDPYAAAFFTGELEGGSFLSRVDLFGGTRSQYHRWAVHAATEIARMSEEFDR
ncbi:DUF7269 family protein [Haloarchaeobius amylolyticus]|uniref:DUF7269 family protein n=1 Tax=Haloarchaeobius amylolyticus TaxID=1198296 RepID=UPI002271F6A9|nr:hypothetical protein [Haloarchaeobius amylolyticus]